MKYDRIITEVTNDLLEQAVHKYSFERIIRHGQRTAVLSEIIARKMGLSEYDIEIIKPAALLHDTAKCTWHPDMDWKRGEDLTPREKEQKYIHSVASSMLIQGYLIAKKQENLFDSRIYEAIECHHERWNGEGVPYGKKGEEIPLFARILKVADASDTMKSTRFYRRMKNQSLSWKQVLEELVDKSGIEFDPEIVKIVKQIASDPKGMEKLEKPYVKLTFISLITFARQYGMEAAKAVHVRG